MKAIRLVLACFLALSLILSPAASLAQAPTQEILQNSLPKSVNSGDKLVLCRRIERLEQLLHAFVR